MDVWRICPCNIWCVWPNWLTLWPTGPVLHITLVQYLIAFCSRPKATSNIISGRFVRPVIADERYCVAALNSLYYTPLCIAVLRIYCTVCALLGVTWRVSMVTVAILTIISVFSESVAQTFCKWSIVFFHIWHHFRVIWDFCLQWDFPTSGQFYPIFGPWPRKL